MAKRIAESEQKMPSDAQSPGNGAARSLWRLDGSCVTVQMLE